MTDPFPTGPSRTRLLSHIRPVAKDKAARNCRNWRISRNLDGNWIGYGDRGIILCVWDFGFYGGATTTTGDGRSHKEID